MHGQEAHVRRARPKHTPRHRPSLQNEPLACGHCLVRGMHRSRKPERERGGEGEGVG